MRATAILGPYATAHDLRPFAAEGVTVSMGAATAPDADAVLIFGGDGTVHRHLRDLAASRVPVLAVACGSGNDFHCALGLGTARAAVAAWRAFTAGRNNVRDIDLGVLRCAGAAEEFFCCVAGVGLDADANRRANAMPRWLRAHGGYALAVVAATLAWRPPVISVNGDTAVSAPAMLAAFANAPAYGSGMRIAPRADMQDGKLDLCFVHRVSRLRLLRFFPRVFSGRHVEMPEVHYAQSRSLRVDGDRPLDVYADGEYVGQSPVEITVAPRALRVIVPERR